MRNLYKAYKLARAKKFELARRQAAEKALSVKSEEQKDCKKGEAPEDKKHLDPQNTNRSKAPESRATAVNKASDSKDQEKTLTIDEFIQKGYLLRALDLPAEGCNTLLTTLLPEDDIPVVPEDRSEAAQVQKALKKI